MGGENSVFCKKYITRKKKKTKCRHNGNPHSLWALEFPKNLEPVAAYKTGSLYALNYSDWTYIYPRYPTKTGLFLRRPTVLKMFFRMMEA